MYKSIIEIKKDVPIEVINNLRSIANKAFDNRAGKVENSSNNPYQLIYSGSEKVYACLELGMLNLKRQKTFLSYLKSWNWIDDENSMENEDILNLLF